MRKFTKVTTETYVDEEETNPVGLVVEALEELGPTARFIHVSNVHEVEVDDPKHFTRIVAESVHTRFHPKAG